MNEALKFKPLLDEARASLGHALIDNDPAIEAVLSVLIWGKHVLLTSVPGLGKTVLGKGTQRLIHNASYGRISFTPDMLPGDIIGRRIWDEQLKVMKVDWGKAMIVNVLLADEINRAIEKALSALLEPLEEGQITIAGETKKLPEVRTCIATRNPIENKGTFTLPEAVLDRFYREVSLRFPRRNGSIALLGELALHDNEPDNQPVLHLEDLLAMKKLATEIVRTTKDSIKGYIHDLYWATQTAEPEFAKLVLEPEDEIQRRRLGENAGKKLADLDVVKVGFNGEGGLSARGMVAQIRVAASNALLAGRTEITFEDVRDTFLSCNRHRLAMSEMAGIEKVTAEDVLRAALRRVKY